MVKLRITYKTKKDHHEFDNHLDIKCDYDPKDGTIENIEVWVYSSRTSLSVDISDIFEKEPFLSIVDNINWEDVYRGVDITQPLEIAPPPPPQIEIIASSFDDLPF